jgi:hypothetical protein
MQKTIIKFYTESVYGVDREKFVDHAQRDIYKALTGRLTLDTVSRELLRDLTGGGIEFQQVINPKYAQHVV